MNTNFNLSDISEEQAKEICKLLEESFHSIIMNDKVAVILFSEQKDGDNLISHYLEINPTGEIGCFFENFGIPHFEAVNGLPVTDYLRKEGFEFAY